MTGPIDLRGRLDIETPEQVSFRLERAGLGSRVLACAIDSALLFLAYAFVLISLVAATGLAGAIEEGSALWIFGLLIIVLTFLLWTYYIAFEVGWNGQTPGKRVLGIRVVGDNGVPATPTQIVVRNLLRFVDFQLGYAVGMVSIVLSPEEKRVGDIVAGTIVVTERRRAQATRAVGPAGEAAPMAGTHPLSGALQDLVRDFHRRAPDLDADTRFRIAKDLADRVAAETGTPPVEEAAAERELLRWVTLGLFAALLLPPAGLAAPVDLVDPFIGTGGHGHTHPAATLPFGMVQLGPDTRLTGWDGCSGYHFTDRAVHGFSHTHLSGTGISDYGDVLFLPLSDDARIRSGLAANFDTTFAMPFDKATEHASPGFYAVTLPEESIGVELTATSRTGWHRYSFPENAAVRVLVDLAHRDEVTESGLRVVGDREIEGVRRSTGWARDQGVWFVARFSRPIVGQDIFREGARTKALLSFGARDGDGGDLVVRVGISGVDVEGARRNLDAEAAGRDFDTVRAMARAAWNRALGRIDVEGGTEEQRRVLYTALYHSLLAPNLWSDVDGRYLGMDREIHSAGAGPRYTVFSLWDTFRATHPLITWIDPDRTADFIRTFLGMDREGGRLPVWELAANETDTMIGYHSVSVIADAWAKGVRGFEGPTALDAMVRSARADRFGLADYRRQGFIGAENESESVSKTLEYAYDDWCIAEMADHLGEADLAAEFRRRAQAWRHLLDPDTGFFRARVDQRFVEPFDPSRVDFHYTEANAWQYGFFVPHDVEGLMEGLGGPEAFVERLDALFSADTTTTGRDQADITGLLGQYAHGNEPSHHMAWLYHYAGRPDRSAERVQDILRRFYRAAPDGLSGNEDCGQMSSWYVLCALGLYPVCPGSPDWMLGVPQFDRATIRLPAGGAFVIEGAGEPAGRSHVMSAEWNGAPLERSFLRHPEIAAAGTLRVVRGTEPSDWGTAPEHRPQSTGGGVRVPAAPFVRGGSAPFRDEVTVSLDCADADAAVFWSAAEAGATDVDPTGASGSEWRQAAGPITFTETTRIRMFSELAGVRGQEVRATFLRIPHDWTVTLVPDPAPQYSASGPATLLDGRSGSTDWRTGAWLGYQNGVLEATVDLGEVRRVERAGAGFLQEIRSWIWMPKTVEVSVSVDGIRYEAVARMPSPLAEKDEKATRLVVSTEVQADARFIRIQARSAGPIPAWHPGAGGAPWIFVDEILIEESR